MSKISSYELNAYDSPNFPPLVNGTWLVNSSRGEYRPRGTVGIDIIVNWMNVIRQTSLHRFKAHKS